jgi:hypothetical protein
MPERADEDDRWSDSHRELVERFVEPVAGRDVGGEFVVAAAQILNERVTGGDDPRGPVGFSPRIGRSGAFSRP